MATLSLCSTSSPSTALSKNQTFLNTLSVPKANSNVTFLSHSFSSLNLRFSKPNSLSSFVPKYSESEAPVAEVEADQEEPVVEATSLEPKREEIFAVVMVGSRQYIVFPGRYIYTQRLKGANVNDKIILNKVLLVGTKTSTWVGKPVVPNATVHAVVEEQLKDKKVIVFKYKKKKNYRRNIGHRQPITRIRIMGITGYQDSPAVTLADLEAAK
ncbi:large ribosomal subunit protein bL21c isoform X1 [Solanum lycopersicum]|uniref:large ribosomal subunit protein bL21c isoform X1 n=1 Tax=Solanum lycopersicum TaxID=4081 RepID=UPI0002765768|nr:50S ribosomal protein L21, chloroplastic isoform X1 [Solanum lycopersicum]